MADIEWNVDLNLQCSALGDWLSYQKAFGFPLGVLAGSAETVWIYPTSNFEFGQPVMSGSTLFIGSFAGQALHHWLTFPNSNGQLEWVFWTSFDTSNAWTLQATDGSTTIEEGTPFVLLAGSSGQYMGLLSGGLELTTVEGIDNALTFTASLTGSEKNPLQPIFPRRR